MASGITLPFLVGIVSHSSPTVISSDDTTNQDGVTIDSQGPWTPPQFSQPALTMITVPATTSGATAQPTASEITYVFDAVLKLSHRRRLHKTQHPVLTGANISDHAYIEPAQVVLDIGMSDAMASFTEGVWVGFSTKSISAWQIIKSLQLNKTLVTITTRLDTYSNMLLLDGDAPDDNKTLHGLRATLVFEEVIAGSVSSQPVSSARPQTSGSTPAGVIQSVPPNSSQTQQNVIPSTLFPNTPTYPQVPGAGVVSSSSLSQVP